MGCESNSAKFLDQMGTSFPFPIPDQDMLIGARGFGACCDPAFADVPSALLAERYTSVRLQLVQQGAIPTPGTAPGDFVLNQSAMPQFFAEGQRASAEALTGIWENQTYAQNNCYPGGSPVDLMQSFLCFGHSFEIVGVGTRGWIGAANSPSDFWKQTVFASKGTGTYESRIMKAVAGRVFAFANFGNTTINYLLGTLVDAPSMSGLYGFEATSAGQPIVGAYKPYKAAFLINARDQSRKLTVSLNSIAGGGAGSSTPIVIEGDTPNPAPPPTATLTDGNLYLEVKMRMFGVPLCWSPDTNCNVPGGAMDANLMAMVRAEIIRQSQGLGTATPVR